MADEHIDELAESYALGMLDGREAARVEAHVAWCDACLRLVGEAEETVLALERQYREEPLRIAKRVTPSQPTRSFGRYAGAIAAGVVLGFGLMLPQYQQNRASQQAVDAMIHSHFAHAPFAPVIAGAPVGKVIYAHDRAWLYVIVSGSYGYEVDAVSGDARRSIGTLRHDGSVSTLFVDHPGTVTAIELTDGTRAIARARL